MQLVLSKRDRCPAAADMTADDGGNSGRRGLWSEPAPATVAAVLGPRQIARDALLTIATLGLYRCWVRTRMRQLVWTSVRIEGAPLRYTGTARELLGPALAAIAGLLVVLAAFAIAKYLAVPRPRVTPNPWRLLVTVPLVYLLGLAAWRHRAFLLERTRLGGLAGGLDGSPHAFARRHLIGALALPLTLGWILPWRQAWQQQALVAGMTLGPHRFGFAPRPSALLGRFVVAWAGVIAVYLSAVLAVAFTMGAKVVAARAAGTLPVLDGRETVIAIALGLASAAAIGLVCAWYRIGAWRSLAAMATLDGRPLSLEASTGAYLRLVVGNTLIRVGSLGLAGHVADLRSARFLLSRLSV